MGKIVFDPELEKLYSSTEAEFRKASIALVDATIEQGFDSFIKLMYEARDFEFFSVYDYMASYLFYCRVVVKIENIESTVEEFSKYYLANKNDADKFLKDMSKYYDRKNGGFENV